MDIADLRREYLKGGLHREDLPVDPMVLFEKWLRQACDAKLSDPTAMSVATVDANGQPFQRMVLLKHYDADGFVFYTNLGSRKAQQIKANTMSAYCSHGTRWSARSILLVSRSNYRHWKSSSIFIPVRKTARSQPGSVSNRAGFRPAVCWKVNLWRCALNLRMVKFRYRVSGAVIVFVLIALNSGRVGHIGCTTVSYISGRVISGISTVWRRDFGFMLEKSPLIFSGLFSLRRANTT